MQHACVRDRVVRVVSLQVHQLPQQDIYSSICKQRRCHGLARAFDLPDDYNLFPATRDTLSNKVCFMQTYRDVREESVRVAGLTTTG